MWQSLWRFVVAVAVGGLLKAALLPVDLADHEEDGCLGGAVTGAACGVERVAEDGKGFGDVIAAVKHSSRRHLLVFLIGSSQEQRTAQAEAAFGSSHHSRSCPISIGSHKFRHLLGARVVRAVH